MTQTLTQPYELVRGQTLIKVPHEEAILSVVHPPEGPDTYINANRAVLNDGLIPLKPEEIASFLLAAYCGPEEFRGEPEVRNIRDLMKKHWIWVPQRNLWTPEGVYVVQDPEAIGPSQPLDIETLEGKLEGGQVVKRVRFSNDGAVRFAPKESYTLGEQDYPLAENGFVIAGYNVEGAENLDEVAAVFKLKPYVYRVDVQKGQEPQQKVSALGSFWGGHWLSVSGDYRGDYRGGCAFGVRKTGEASAKK